MQKLRHLTRREIDEITMKCCLPGELSCVLTQLAQGRSLVQIADNLRLSTTSVSRRVREIKDRMTRM